MRGLPTTPCVGRASIDEHQVVGTFQDQSSPWEDKNLESRRNLPKGMRTFAGNGNIVEPQSKGVERRPVFANSTARSRCVGDTFGSRRFCEISPRICARRAGRALGPHSSCAQSAGSMVVVVILRGDTRQLCLADSEAELAMDCAASTTWQFGGA